MKTYKETDPNGKTYHEVGAKMDAEKPRLGLVLGGFATALEYVGVVGTYGANKYRDGGWLLIPDAKERYMDALLRHLLHELSGEHKDPDSGMKHAAHLAWNALAYLQLTLNQESTDARNHDEKMSCLSPGQADNKLLPESTEEEGLCVRPMLRRNSPELSSESQADPVVHLQRRITKWADRVIPDRTAMGALSKLMLHEIPELLNGGLDDPHEYADVLILVLDIASLRGIDAVQAAHDKMSINERRSWKKDPETGLMQHIEEENHGNQ